MRTGEYNRDIVEAVVISMVQGTRPVKLPVIGAVQTFKVVVTDQPIFDIDAT